MRGERDGGIGSDLRAEADGEPLSAESLAAIEEGLEDIQAGRTVSREQIKRESGL